MGSRQSIDEKDNANKIHSDYENSATATEMSNRMESAMIQERLKRFQQQRTQDGSINNNSTTNATTAATSAASTAQVLPGASPVPPSNPASSVKRPTTGEGDAPQSKLGRYDNFQNSQLHRENETLLERRALIKKQNEAYEKSLKADKAKEKIKENNVKAQEELQQRKLEAELNLPLPPDDNETGIICLRNFILSHKETPLCFEIIRYPNEIVPSPDPANDAEKKGLIMLQELGFKNKELFNIRERLQKKIPNLFETKSELE